MAVSRHTGNPDIMPEKLRLLLPLVYMMGIYLLSSIPDTGRVDTQIDKIFHWMAPELQNLLHIPLFGGLAGCWYWAVSPWVNGFNNKILTAFILTTIYSFADEYHQLSVPGRFGSFTDIGLNAAGAVLILAAIMLLHNRK